MAKIYRPYVPEQVFLFAPSLREWLPEASRKPHTKAGATVYAARKAIVEPVIGQIKQARGFRQFLLRGFEKVQGEFFTLDRAQASHAAIAESGDRYSGRAAGANVPITAITRTRS